MPFEVTESAYNLTPDIGTSGKQFVRWAAVLSNPNKAYFGMFPILTVTARDALGAVVGTADQTLFDFPPGATIAFSAQIEATQAPARVDFTPGKVTWRPTSQPAAAFPPFGSTGVSLTPDPVSGYTVNGEITNPYGASVDEVATTALLRDASGKLIGGSTSFIQGLPANGSHPFSIDTGKTEVTAAKVEIISIPWGTVEDVWTTIAAGKAVVGAGGGSVSATAATPVRSATVSPTSIPSTPPPTAPSPPTPVPSPPAPPTLPPTPPPTQAVVPAPSAPVAPAAPAGATARCNDGTYSSSQQRRGTCSGHGGVSTFLVSLPP